MLADLLAKILANKPDDPRLFARAYFMEDNVGKTGLHPPLVFVGPSGVGKGTLIARLMKYFGPSMGFSVSHTTRQPRPGEEHGTHYNFSRRESMEFKIDQGLFVEYANVHVRCFFTCTIDKRRHFCSKKALRYVKRKKVLTLTL